MEVLKKVTLRTDRISEHGEREIRIRLTLYKEQKFLSIGYKSTPEHWDFETNGPKLTHPQYKQISREIDDKFDEIDFEVKLLKKNGHEFISLAELISKVKKSNKPLVAAKLYAFTQSIIDDLIAHDKIGYANTFQYLKDYVLKHVFGEKDKAFVSFTKTDFEGLENYLVGQELKETSMSAYLRTFYRIWNLAIVAGMCSKEHHPKRFIKFKPYKKYKTSKRAISAADMKSIETYDAEYGSRVFRSQQIFLFSYYCRGINFNDIVKLRETNFKGDILRYTRSKNKRIYDFKLHSKAKAIIEIFRSYPVQSDGGYIFPILKAEHDTAAKIDARIDSGLKDLNEDLKTIKDAKGIDRTVTSYVARHSFATNLKHKKVDICIIQEAMGHETEEITRIYLEEYDDELVSSSIEEALD
ncbi:tyrosine-type recombinase/integrase [Mucilaginibacter aquaedulcis]|uniref:tyrosine-type recombinase/integrase n=1 Tax=Mucilaginibacter aquaedulcis TaxID=1187081 RepID=UPI0025B3318F|nr:tyrosine-type recombinase/integrase [Mucilaginibacter aquaedulcis]MDN3551641.1 tyrosine-type recombinase/integrase [Mucilaginibacter aquaedulcis]